MRSTPTFTSGRGRVSAQLHDCQFKSPKRRSTNDIVFAFAGFIPPVTPPVRGQSPGHVARGPRFVCCPRNPQNINFLGPTGKIGGRGHRDRVLRA